MPLETRTTAAWAYSAAITFWPGLVAGAGIEPMTYFDSAAVIVGLVLAGRWLDVHDEAAGSLRFDVASVRPDGRGGWDVEMLTTAF